MTCDSLSEDGPLGGVFLDIDFCISQPRISARKLETCHRNDVKAENERQFTKRCHFPSAVRLYGHVAGLSLRAHPEWVPVFLFFSGLFLHPVLLHHMCHRVVAVLIATNHKLPRVAFLPHPLPSPLLRQYIISCLLNTWRQSQQGNYWGHSHVCTQPSLTHRTSFRRVKRPCCCKRRTREQQHGLVISPWHVTEMIQQMSLRLELIKPGICCCFFIRQPDLEPCQDQGWGSFIPCT